MLSYDNIHHFLNLLPPNSLSNMGDSGHVHSFIRSHDLHENLHVLSTSKGVYTFLPHARSPAPSHTIMRRSWKLTAAGVLAVCVTVVLAQTCSNPDSASGSASGETPKMGAKEFVSSTINDNKVSGRRCSACDLSDCQCACLSAARPSSVLQARVTAAVLSLEAHIHRS